MAGQTRLGAAPPGIDAKRSRFFSSSLQQWSSTHIVYSRRCRSSALFLVGCWSPGTKWDRKIRTQYRITQCTWTRTKFTKLEDSGRFQVNYLVSWHAKPELPCWLTQQHSGLEKPSNCGNLPYRDFFLFFSLSFWMGMIPTYVAEQRA